MTATVGAYNILLVTNTPTRFDDDLLALLVRVEIRGVFLDIMGQLRCYCQNINKNLKDKTVQQFSFDGILLNEYKNLTEAANKNNISVYALSSCLNYKTYTSGGYIWLYKETFTKSNLEEKMAAAKRIKEREKAKKYGKRFVIT